MTISVPEKLEELCEFLNKHPDMKKGALQPPFDGFKKRINLIQQFLAVEKYRIVFIGAPGKGKTTTICNWLGLLKKEKVGAKQIESLSLLTTASGRTTAAEVHVRQVQGRSRICLDYLSDERQKSYIKDYCEYYYKECRPVEEAVVDEREVKGDPHIEIDRIVRNMAGIERYPVEKGKEADEKRAAILAKMSQYKDANAFYEAVLAKINLPARKAANISLPADMEFEAWLSQVFKQINEGRHPSCSIPACITIEVSESDLNLGLPDYVGEVVDTIGLDGLFREDLKKLLTAPDTVCFLIDNEKAVPTPEIQHLIRNAYTDWDRYSVAKTSILVNSKARDLAAVNEANGDAEKGKEIKLLDLDACVKQTNLLYNIENTLFVDPCEAFSEGTKREKVLDSDGKVVMDPNTGIPKFKLVTCVDHYDEETAEVFKMTMNGKINVMLTKMKENLVEDIEAQRNGIIQLLEMEAEYENNTALRELVALRAKIVASRENLRPTLSDSDAVARVVMSAVGDINWRTVRKMNSLYGAYQLWHTDIYTQIGSAGQEIFTEKVRVPLSRLRNFLIDVRDSKARNFTEGLINILEYEVRVSTDKAYNGYLRWAYDDQFVPRSDDNPFWVDVNSYSGRGYKKRVEARYREYIYDSRKELVNMIVNAVDDITGKIISKLPTE